MADWVVLSTNGDEPVLVNMDVAATVMPHGDLLRITTQDGSLVRAKADFDHVALLLNARDLREPSA